jgi:hypothetical protein
MLTLVLNSYQNKDVKTKTLSLFVALASLPMLAGCATGAALVTGVKRPPIDPGQVRIYSAPPPKYEEVAIISANSYWSWAWNEQAKMDTATRELRVKAAKLGANGVVVKNLGNAAISAGGLGTGAGALALGAASINNMTTLDGVAIYVPTAQ